MKLNKVCNHIMIKTKKGVHKTSTLKDINIYFVKANLIVSIFSPRLDQCKVCMLRSYRLIVHLARLIMMGCG